MNIFLTLIILCSITQSTYCAQASLCDLSDTSEESLEASFSELTAHFTPEDEIQRTREDREYELKDLESQLNINLQAIEKNTDLGEKARLQEQITCVNKHLETLKRLDFPQKDIKKMRTQLQKQYDACPSDTLYAAAASVPQKPSSALPSLSSPFEQEIRSTAWCENVRECIIKIGQLSNNCARPQIQAVLFCPNHGYFTQNLPSITLIDQYPAIALPKGKPKKFTQATWETWIKEDSNRERKEVKIRIFFILKGFESFQDEELFANLGKIYNFKWNCTCTKK